MTYVVQRWRTAVVAVCAVATLGGCEGSSDTEGSSGPVGQSRVTELASDAVVDVAIVTVDQLGTQQARQTGVPLLRFIAAAGDEDSLRFRAAADQDSRHQISEAWRRDDLGALQVALDRAGRLEGQVVAAQIRHQLEASTTAEAGELTALRNDLVSAAYNDFSSVERSTIVQAALDAGVIDADGLGRVDHTVRGERVVLGTELDGEDLGEVYFDLDLDRGTYRQGWESGFGGVPEGRSPE